MHQKKNKSFYWFALWQLVLFCICGINKPTFGQLLHFERFGFDEGMPHTEVNDVIQGPDHRIYAATEEGLAVFDGFNFEVFTRRDNLESDDIHLLFTDKEERIWIASSNGGLNYYYQDSIYAVSEIKKRLQGKKVYEIFQRADSTLCFVTGFDVIAVKSDTMYSMWAKLQKPAPEKAGNLAALFQDSILYINQQGYHFIKINLNSFKWNWINNKKPLPAPILSISINEEGRLFFSGNRGLIEFRSDTFHSVHEHLPGRCWDIDFDRDGHLNMFSEGGGFGKYLPDVGVFHGFTTFHGLSTNVFFGGTTDHESNIWLASHSEGLIRFRDQSLRKYQENSSIAISNVQSMAAIGDNLYLATRRGVVRMVNEHIIDTLLPGRWITSVHSASDHLLVGTLHEVYKIYPDHRVVKEADCKGNLEIEVNRRRFSITTGDVYVRHPDVADTISVGWVKSLVALEKDFILMLDHGVALYDGDTTFFLSEFDAYEYGSFRSTINWRNDVLIKSDDHLHRITKKQGKLDIEEYDISAIPFVDQLNAMAAAGDSLWLSGPGQFVVLHLKDLVKKSQVNFSCMPISQSFIKSAISNNGILFHQGKIYGRSAKGLIVFDPKKYRSNTKEPTLKLLDVKLFGKSLKKNRWQKNEAEFDASENNLSFKMAARTFVNVSGVQFKYRLSSNGSTEEWIGPIKNSEVIFSNLIDGQYRFEFIANNGHGIWNKKPATFNFVISKPFWKKSIFWVFLVSGILISGLLFVLYRSKQRLQSQQLLKTKLIEIQEQERKRIARELHDSVGQKIMLMSIQAKEIGSREINDLALSSLDETRNISQGLHPVILDQLGLTNGLRDLIAKVDEYSDVLIDASIVHIDYLIPENQWIHVFRIVQELLSNCIKHAQANTCSINIASDDKAVMVSVKDNGKGFDFNSIVSSGIGLQSVHDRASLMGASVRIDTRHGTSVMIKIPIKA